MKRTLFAWIPTWLLACSLLCTAFAAQAAPAEETVRMGFYVKVTRDLSRAEVQAALGFWAEEMAKQSGITMTVRFYDDMHVLRRDFDLGVVNFVLTSSMDFVRNFKVDELADGFNTAMQVDHTLMLASRTESDIHTLDQMVGKRITLLKDDELSSVYLETLCLRHHRRACKDVFSAIDVADTGSKLVLKLFFGKTDMILVRKNNLAVAKELNPQIGRVIRVVSQLPVKATYYGLYSLNVDKAFRTRSLVFVSTMHQTPRGRQVLNVFKADRLELAPATDLLPVVRLNQEYENLLADVVKTRMTR